MHQNLYKRTYRYTALAVAITLAGCHGDGDKSTNSGSPEYMIPASISAQNANFITDYRDSYLVDLSDKVSVGGGRSFKLLDVTALSNAAECQPLEIMAKNFTVAAQSTKVCDYQYKVVVTDDPVVTTSSRSSVFSSASLSDVSTDTAITRVAVMSAIPASSTEVALPAVSAVAFEEQTLEVDIRYLLESQTGIEVTTDFTLSEELSLPYTPGFSSADADPLTNTITYTPFSGFEGIERILFSYINNDTGEVLLGTLDIAVTIEANQGLSVKDNIVYGQVAVNEKVEISVVDYVDSFDGDDYQLVYVESFNAATEPRDAEDLSNKDFYFETSQLGNHYISFAVTDNNGAYGLGLMEVSVFDPYNRTPWGGIESQSLWFSGPLSTSDAILESVEYSEVKVDSFYDPAVNLALFDTSSAQSYCGTRGRMPTSSELVALSSEDVQANHNWPVSAGYFADDNGVIKVVDLATGDLQSYVEGNYLATCVEGGLTSESLEDPVIANNIEQAQITFQLKGENNAPVEGAGLYFTNTGEAALEASFAVTDTNGIAIATLKSTKAENVSICAEIGIQNSCTSVTFIADPATAMVREVEVSDISNWQSSQAYTFNALVTDAYDNPVPNVDVLSNVTRDDFNLSVSPSRDNAVTNTLGIASFFVSNNENNAIDVTEHTMSHTNTSGETSEHVAVGNWGMWQWTIPHAVEFTKSRTNLPTDQLCKSEFGEEWSLMSAKMTDDWLAFIDTQSSVGGKWDPITYSVDNYITERNYVTFISQDYIDDFSYDGQSVYFYTESGSETLGDFLALTYSPQGRGFFLYGSAEGIPRAVIDVQASYVQSGARRGVIANHGLDTDLALACVKPL